ncbi:MAG TPA: ATP-dependent Clp protease ATP-binding subunit ClpX [Marinagarivorans sp.]|nr:ATP-dependent Clp protease ATP-binding subunit ClpX [Marinagarivorans sp.]
MAEETGTELNAAKATPCCSFCGTPKTAEVPLIAGNDGHICEQCIKLAYQVVSSWGRKAAAVKPELKTPVAIKSFLDEYIVGQEQAKRTLAVAVYNHYLRFNAQANTQPFAHIHTIAGVELEKSNVLLAGPSGSGKTLLVKTLARIIGVPIVVGDATSLTQAGYVGEDVDSLLKRLLDAANGDVQQAQWGIVYIDEIDKLARRGAGGSAVRDISGEGVQQALLKMVEGSEVRLPKAGRRDGHSEDVVMNTSNILFIVGGAFSGLTELISKRLKPAIVSIGFNAKVEKDAAATNDELLAALQPDDLHQFGLIPEFIGRFPIVTFLQDLDVEALKSILKDPRNALTKQYHHLFALQGVDLHFSDEAITLIAQQAVTRGTGARGLRAILEGLLCNPMFNLPTTANLTRVAVNTRLVEEEEQLVVDEIIGEGEAVNKPKNLGFIEENTAVESAAGN